MLFFAGLYSHAERAGVRVVTIDCHAPYRAVARVVFPNALIVADAFHLHRRVLAALTEVRRDAWNRWRHRRRRLGKPFKDARFALARSREDLEADDSRTGQRQRLALYDATNLDAPLAMAYELKEAFRSAMAIGRTGDVETFTATLELFDALCLGLGIEAFVTLAKTLRGWRAEIVNYAASGGASNGFAEAMNHLIKNQKRQAHGYRTWAGFRGQILWAFGEAVDPETGEIKPLRMVPRGIGANWIQPSFA